MLGARCRMRAQHCWVQSTGVCMVQDAFTALVGAQHCWVQCCWVHSVAGGTVHDACTALLDAQCRMGARHCWLQCCWVHSAGCMHSLGGCTALLGAQCRMHARHCWVPSIAGCSVAGCTVQDACTVLLVARRCWAHGAGRCTSAAPSPQPGAKFHRPHRKRSALSEPCRGPGRPEGFKARAGGEKAGQPRAASVTLARSRRPSRKRSEGSAVTSPGAQRAVGHGVRAPGTAGTEQTLRWRCWGSRG